jgi:hypothetical protein
MLRFLYCLKRHAFAPTGSILILERVYAVESAFPEWKGEFAHGDDPEIILPIEQQEKGTKIEDGKFRLDTGEEPMAGDKLEILLPLL